jgi:hypothetical protein
MRFRGCACRDVGILEYGQINEGGQRPISFHLDVREEKILARIDKAKRVPLVSFFYSCLACNRLSRCGDA